MSARQKQSTQKTAWILGGLAITFVAIALFFAPKTNELQAMQLRAAQTEAEELMADGENGRAVEVLRAALEENGEDQSTVRVLLNALERSGDTNAHAEILTGSDNDWFNVEDYRRGEAMYAAAGDQENRIRVLKQIVARGDAKIGDLYRLAQNTLGDTSDEETLEYVRQISAKLEPGTQPEIGVFVLEQLAAHGHQTDAEAFALRWLGEDASDRQVAAIVPAVIEVGQAGLAVRVVATRKDNTDALAGAYRYALEKSAPSSPEHRTQLTSLLLADLDTAMSNSDAFTNAENKEEFASMVHTLFGAGDVDQAKEHVLAHHDWRGEPLRTAFLFALKENGRGQEARALMVQDARTQRPGAASFVKLARLRDAADELVAFGATTEAEVLLKDATFIEGPSGGAFKDLAYLWKSNRTGIDRVWVSQQMTRANPVELENWTTALSNAFDPASAARLLSQVEPGLQGAAKGRGALLTAKFTVDQINALPNIRRVAYTREGQTNPAVEAIRRAGKFDLVDRDLLELSSLACANGEARLAMSFAARLSNGVIPNDKCLVQARLDMAREALGKGDIQAARVSYDDPLIKEAMTARDHFDLAYAMNEAGQTRNAERHFQTAMDMFDRDGVKSAEEAMLRVETLTQLERPAEAMAELETILHEYPGERQARVILAEMYLNFGDAENALRVAQ